MFRIALFAVFLAGPLAPSWGDLRAPYERAVWAEGYAAPDPDPQPELPHGGQHPISLQWIGWGPERGTATVTPTADGWYDLHGSQRNGAGEYLKIDGRIRRLSPKELAFEGTVETRTASNYSGRPCIKTGPQRFFAKGARRYYRLQNMDNCMGENVVDYVDIYPGTSSL